MLWQLQNRRQDPEAQRRTPKKSLILGFSGSRKEGVRNLVLGRGLGRTDHNLRDWPLIRTYTPSMPFWPLRPECSTNIRL
jgi:hypothetical protein